MPQYRTVIDPAAQVALVDKAAQFARLSAVRQRRATKRDMQKQLKDAMDQWSMMKKASYITSASGWYVNTSATASTSITVTAGTGGGMINTGDGVLFGSDDGYVQHAAPSPEERREIIEGMLTKRYGNWLKLVSDENGQRLKILKDFLPKLSLELPDGHVLDMDQEGNFKIVAKDAKVTYKANGQREFNRYINASDLLAQFIKDLGMAGATQKQVLQVPLELFINWLVIRAAEQDEEQVPADVPKLADLPKLALPRCRQCGRFLSRTHMEVNFSFCNGMHADRFMAARKSPVVRLPLKVKS